MAKSRHTGSASDGFRALILRLNPPEFVLSLKGGAGPWQLPQTVADARRRSYRMMIRDDVPSKSDKSDAKKLRLSIPKDTRLRLVEIEDSGEMWRNIWHGKVRVRNRPDKGSSKIGSLLEGEIVEKFAQNGSWILHSRGWTMTTVDKCWLLVPHTCRSKKRLMKLVKCKSCKRIFTRESKAENHTCVYDRDVDEDPSAKLPPTPCRKVLQKPTFKCKVCGKKFVSANSLNSHSWVHGGSKNSNQDGIRCKHCPKRLPTNEDLIRHMRDVHYVPVENVSVRGGRSLRRRSGDDASGESGDAVELQRKHVKFSNRKQKLSDSSSQIKSSDSSPHDPGVISRKRNLQWSPHKGAGTRSKRARARRRCVTTEREDDT